MKSVCVWLMLQFAGATIGAVQVVGMIRRDGKLRFRDDGGHDRLAEPMGDGRFKTDRAVRPTLWAAGVTRGGPDQQLFQTTGGEIVELRRTAKGWEQSAVPRRLWPERVMLETGRRFQEVMPGVFV